jgi:predicted lipoprotein with Yx(FWY)xxD motif
LTLPPTHAGRIFGRAALAFHSAIHMTASGGSAAVVCISNFQMEDESPKATTLITYQKAQARGGPRRVARLFLALGALAIAAAGCAGSYAGTAAPASAVAVPATMPAASYPATYPTTSPATAPRAALGTDKSSLGLILVNSKGRTIYAFANDRIGTSVCNGECANDWPPVAAPASLPASWPGVTGELGTTTRRDGTRQLTIGGHPLYTYEGDSAPGQTNGQGLVLNGGVWHVVSAAGAPVSNAKAAPAMSAPYGGGGY